jgi:hypothetical protein
MPFSSDPFDLDDVQWPALYARVEARPGYRVLAGTDATRAVVMVLLRTAGAFGVASVAYCVMPDHVQVALLGRAGGADPRAALRRWKQLSGGDHRLRTGQTLWRPRCAERLLHEPAELWEAVSYLLEEPVRGGLVRVPAEYRWSWAPESVARHCASAGQPAARPAWWPDRIISGCRSGYSSPR